MVVGFCCGASEDGVSINLSSKVRTATFTISRFSLAGICVSVAFEGEPELFSEMLGASIDVDELQKAQSIEAALMMIAANTSALCCRLLSDCYRERVPIAAKATSAQHACEVVNAQHCQYRPVDRSTRSEIATTGPALDKLPLALLQRILCMTGSLRASAILSQTCRALRRPYLPEDATRCGLAVPLCCRPGTHSCDASVVAWDEAKRSLRKTARIGHPLLIFSDELLNGSTAVLLELEVTSLAGSVGGVQLGVLAAVRDPASYATPSLSATERCWIDGLGCLHMGSGVSMQHEWVHAPHGDRLRQGDRLGVLFIALLHEIRIGFTRDGALVGPTVPLRPACNDGGRLRGYYFFVQLDTVEGIEVRLVPRTTPVDVGAVLRTRAPLRPLAPHEPPLVVRTVGPDSQGMGIGLHPHSARVRDLRAACALKLGCEPSQVALRVENVLGNTKRAPSTSRLLHDDDEKLSSAGIWLQPNGCHMSHLIAHVPHMIS
mmetsp:Transcript_1455/g.2838  ORF Transcript_1455/g.2838 Transcript_1455/m.2838 type:complete len:491 (+) Transcript_1455:78-1550(+)